MVGKRSAKLRMEHILEKNYRVLTNILESGATSLPLEQLSLLGFNPYYSTCCFKKGKREVRMCFDISYILTQTKIFKIEYVSIS